MNPIIESPRWKALLEEASQQAYYTELMEFVLNEREKFPVYPASDHVFAALAKTPFEKVKVIIVGQDPYHGPGQANGLAFSVAPGMALPPSLRNIFKELRRDLPDTGTPFQGDLSPWAEQGVLLLNATLTVRANAAGSHQGKGWEQLTDFLLKALSEEQSGLVILLWGSYAQQKSLLFDASKQLILKAPHPSPLSAHRGFIGCSHFSKTNEFLVAQGHLPIDWRV